MNIRQDNQNWKRKSKRSLFNGIFGALLLGLSLIKFYLHLEDLSALF